MIFDFISATKGLRENHAEESLFLGWENQSLLYIFPLINPAFQKISHKGMNALVHDTHQSKLALEVHNEAGLFLKIEHETFWSLTFPNYAKHISIKIHQSNGNQFFSYLFKTSRLTLHICACSIYGRTPKD